MSERHTSQPASEPADLYAELLGVEPGPRPPNHYDLLGLDRFAADPAKIHEAVLRCTASVRKRALDRDPDRARRIQELLNEIGRAAAVLEDEQRRAEYNRVLLSSIVHRPLIKLTSETASPYSLPAVAEPTLLVSRPPIDRVPSPTVLEPSAPSVPRRRPWLWVVAGALLAALALLAVIAARR